MRALDTRAPPRIAAMMKRESFEIEKIYVPVKRRATLNPATVDALAADILEHGLKTPTASCWSRACTGSKPAGRSAKPPSPATWCRRAGIDAGHLHIPVRTMLRISAGRPA
jgi:hypothetical protein